MSAFERLLEQKAVALQYSPEKDSAPAIVKLPEWDIWQKRSQKQPESQEFLFMRMIPCNSFKQITAGSGCAGRIISGDHRNLHLFFRYVPSSEEKENETKSENT